jgi:molybdate transport system substrate-binding protein
MHRILVIALMLVAGAAVADEFKVMSTTAMRSALHDLIPQFERSSGHKVAIIFDTGNLVVGRLKGGEAADMVILTGPSMEDAVKLGKIAGSPVVVARSGMGVGVRDDAPKPDIRTVDGFKKALLDAKSIAYSTSGASGIYFAGLIDKLGIGDQVRAKAKRPAGGGASTLILKGEAEMAVQQIPEILDVRGVQLVGPLPREVQLYTTFPAALTIDSKQPAASKQFLAFLSTPAAAKLMQAKGMEPPQQ